MLIDCPKAVCDIKGIDEQKAWANAAWLAATLAKKYDIPLVKVVPHKHWTGKNCPSRILPQWSKFLNMIDKGLNAMDKPQQPKPEPVKNDVTVIVDGKQIKDGILINDVSYVPARAIAEAFGAGVKWDQGQKTVTISKGAAK